MIYAGTKGYLDNVPVDRVKEWQANFMRALSTQFAELANGIAEKKTLDDTQEATTERCTECLQCELELGEARPNRRAFFVLNR